MKAIIQRVSWARVTVDQEICGQIKQGLVVFLGVAPADNEPKAQALADKIMALRIFNDDQGKMNLAARNINAQLLIVSQFTLYGNTAKGNRPSFENCAPPHQAQKLYDYFIAYCQESGLDIQTGIFGAHMQVELLNDGPVTYILEK